MKRLATLFALAGLLAVPALADQATGGISGIVTNVTTGQPIDHATILYYRAPYIEKATVIKKIETNGKGFFSDITLEPGRYVVMAQVPGQVLGCSIDDVMSGETSQMKIAIGKDSVVCSGPRVHPAMIDPNATADVYRI